MPRECVKNDLTKLLEPGSFREIFFLHLFARFPSNMVALNTVQALNYTDLKSARAQLWLSANKKKGIMQQIIMQDVCTCFHVLFFL